ncbi:organic cation transporter protein-like [Glandiceps talaboti]
MELDEALSVIGEWGLYQTIIYWLITIPGTWFCVWPMMSVVFQAGFPEAYYCQVPTGALVNETIPVSEIDDDGYPVYESCVMYTNLTVDNSTTSCMDGWYYESETFQETIVTEWDLVCDKEPFSQISQSIFMVGAMLGAFIAGSLSDRFGRKKIYLFTMWAESILGILTAFTQSFITYTLLRFLTGIMLQGVMVSNLILATEMFPPGKRLYAGFMNTISWGFGIMLLAPMAYLVPNWRNLQLLMHVPGLLTLYYYWVIPESMRWLISKGKVEKAETILYRAAKFNKKQLPEDVLSPNVGVDDYRLDDGAKNDVKGREFPASDVTIKADSNSYSDDKDMTRVLNKAETNGHVYDDPKKENIKDDELDVPKYTLLDLCRRPRLAFNTSVMCFAWFVTSLVYFGISFNTANVGDGVYVAFFFNGFVEIPGNFIALYASLKFGRRIPTSLFLVVAGLACGSTVFIPEETSNGTDLVPLQLTVFLLGKFAITGAFASFWTWAPELFPTLIRNMGFGLTNFFASLGGVVAPFTVYIAYSNLRVIMVSFGVLSLLTSAVVLLLPETKDQPMPRTIEEAEEMAKMNKKKKSGKDTTVENNFDFNQNKDNGINNLTFTVDQEIQTNF